MDQELSEICEFKSFRKGDVILQQDDKADGMYVIKSGKVNVLRDGQILATLEEGDFFGAMGLLLRERRSATVQAATEEVSTYFLSKEDFEKAKEDLGEEVINKALERYKETYRKYI